jgi:hypothetical protein
VRYHSGELKKKALLYPEIVLAIVQSRVGSQDTILSEIILLKGVTPWPIYPLKTRFRASLYLFTKCLLNQSQQDAKLYQRSVLPSEFNIRPVKFYLKLHVWKILLNQLLLILYDASKLEPAKINLPTQNDLGSLQSLSLKTNDVS